MTRNLLMLAMLAACSSKGAAKKPVDKLTDAEQACDALTVAEVEAETHLKTTARMLPKAGEYGAPECGWLISEDPKARGVTVTLFFQDTEADSKEYFGKKLDSVCREGKLEVPALGDEAAFCGRLWVRRGTSYFSVSTQGGGVTPDQWQTMATRLAEHVLPRLP